LQFVAHQTIDMTFGYRDESMCSNSFVSPRPDTLAELHGRPMASNFFFGLYLMSIVRGVISLTIVFHRPENVSAVTRGQTSLL